MHCAYFRLSPLALAISAALIAGASAAYAADPQLEAITVTGDRPATAPYEAPTQGSLDAGEPQSIIGKIFIENNTSTAANYTDIISIAPSVSNVTANGSGLAESLNMSIRGFQDGQFNVTLDGIPWNDSNDFTHHSTSYFTADTIGRINVDRGPGTASQVGNATFGGTVALETKDPSQTHTLTPSVTLGSFRTQVYSAEYDTGTLQQAGGGRGMLTLTSVDSDGAMTDNAQKRKNAFFKYVQPIGADTTVTGAAMYNTLHQNVGQFGTTLANLAKYGPTFSMNSNPSSEAYYGFNYDDIHTDLEYIDVKTLWSGWHLDNKAYTYGYYHKINETNDLSYLTSGALAAYVDTPAQSGALAAGNPGYIDPASVYGQHVAGQQGYNNYRSVGDIIRADHDIGPGLVRFGLWADYQWNDRYLADVDWTAGGTVLNIPFGNDANANGVQRNQHNTLTTLAPFVEYEFRPMDDLTLTPGVRYTSFERTGDDPVNQGTLAPRNFSHTWHAAQPSIYALYHLASNWSVYGQYARGFLAPNLNLTYKSSLVGAESITPQLTDNLQAGTTWKSDRLTVSADIYHIKFNNFISLIAGGAGSQAAAGGGALFKGEEVEGTFVVGYGVSVYANGSHNSAKYNDGTSVLNAPDATTALGLIYDNGPLYASFISKHVGSTVQQGAGTGNLYNVDGFTTNNVAVVYTFHAPDAGARNVRLKFSVDNLSNNQMPYFVEYGGTMGTSPSGATAPQDTWLTLPGRAYMVGVSADF